MSNETEAAMLAVLNAEPPQAMIALALRRLPEDAGIARRLAALGCALQGHGLDLAAKHLGKEPAVKAAAEYEKWLGKQSDAETGVLALHFAVTLMAGDDASPDALTDAASRVYAWVAKGETGGWFS